jgi:hypothetical protein
MAELVDIVMAKLREARLNGRAHAMVIHGKSTSRRGKTTARSQVPARKAQLPVPVRTRRSRLVLRHRYLHVMSQGEPRAE